MIPLNPAKRYLREIRRLDVLIEMKLEEIDLWKSRALSTTVSTEGERVKSSGDQQKMASAIDRAIDASRAADALIDQRYERIQVIQQLDDGDKIKLLYAIYVNGHTLQEAADIIDRPYNTARAIHGQALRDVLEIINTQQEGGTDGH